MDCAKAGRLIRTLRLERGLTQAELAEVLCVSPKTVSKWENGKRLPGYFAFAGAFRQPWRGAGNASFGRTLRK